MFDNEVRIPIKKEDILDVIKWCRLNHEVSILEFYLQTTINKQFIDLYKETLIEFNKIDYYIKNKYLKNIKYKRMKIDLSNNDIVYQILECIKC